MPFTAKHAYIMYKKRVRCGLRIAFNPIKVIKRLERALKYSG